MCWLRSHAWLFCLQNSGTLLALLPAKPCRVPETYALTRDKTHTRTYTLAQRRDALKLMTRPGHLGDTGAHDAVLAWLGMREAGSETILSSYYHDRGGAKMTHPWLKARAAGGCENGVGVERAEVVGEEETVEGDRVGENRKRSKNLHQRLPLSLHTVCVVLSFHLV